MSNASLTERQELLLQHLDSIYLLAQAVSPDGTQAAQLVEATYIQAFITPPLNHTFEDDKRWLFQLLMQIHREQTEVDHLDDEGETHRVDAVPALESLNVLRRRLARQIVDRALPVALTTLPDRQWLILLLCDAEGLSCADAARVLDLEAEEDARGLLEQARLGVENVLQANVSDPERRLLNQSLSADWLRATLRRTIEAEFSPVPPSLRQSVFNITEPTDAEQGATDAPATSNTALTTAAPDADPSKPQRHQTILPRLRRFSGALLLILTVALIGYVISRSLEKTPETNLITLSVQQADAVRSAIETPSPEQAEAFVLTELNWRLTLPTIHHTVLKGVGTREVARGVTVPVFLYEDTFNDASAQQITLYVFTYALLDQYRDRIQLDSEILRQIQDDLQFDLHDLGERNALVWRSRDDIYVAVTSGDPEALRQRIVFPS